MYPYLAFLLLFFALPVALLAWLCRRSLTRFPRTALWLWLFVSLFGGLWDWLSCRTGLWRYDTAPTLGLWLGPLPVEEFLGFYVLAGALIFLTLLALRGRHAHV